MLKTNKNSQITAQHNNFLQWSIPQYFIQNYKSKAFHKACSQNCMQNKQNSFIKHTIQYLTDWIMIFRGNWIQKFNFTANNIIKKQKNDQEHQGAQFNQLLQQLHLDYNILLITQFIVKFYRMLCLNMKDKQQSHQVELLTQIYYKYRLQLSLAFDIQLDKQELLNLFIRYFVHKMMSQHENDGQFSNQCMRKMQNLAQLCQFQEVYSKILQQYINKFEKKQKNEEFITKQFSKLDRSKSQSYQVAHLQKNYENICTTPKKNKNRKFQDSQEQIYSKQKHEMQLQKSVKKAIDKKKRKNLEVYRKVTKTTRFSNFKGKFVRKTQQKINCFIFNDEVRYDQNNLIEKRICQAKIKLEKNEDGFDRYDFLCDKSF